MRTRIYIDGFNLYYGSLKGTAFKWLDLGALFRSLLPAENDIQGIKYFTARVKARADNPAVHLRQQVYLRAIKAHVPNLEIIEGRFTTKPTTLAVAPPGKGFARVLKTEEKGSDVNLAVHMVNDAWNDRYDCAVVCSNDSDLEQALEIVKRERKKHVVLVTPGDPKLRPTTIGLARWAHAVKRITNAQLAAAQLPNTIPKTTIFKPAVW